MPLVRIPLAQLLTLITLFVAVSFQSAFAQQAAADWAITFDMEESFRGDQLPRVIHLQVDSSGKYIATYRLVSDNADTAKLHTDEGVIEEQLAAHLKDWLTILKESNLGANEQVLNLGFGATLTPGWRGSLLVTQLEHKTSVKFDSLRAQNGERPKTYNQLVTFLFDLKRFVLGKFDLNIKRAVNPEDAQQ